MSRDPSNPPDTILHDVRHGDRTWVIKPIVKVVGAVVRSPAALLAEAVSLAEAIELNVVESRIVTLATVTPATLLGKGMVEEIAEHIETQAIALVVVDHALTPVQQRNLEKKWSCKVIDRTGLILEIFGERARTKEGQLQVELAALAYQRSRLVRSWTHLERQRGGFGFMGGPGESQLEIDRRLIDGRIVKLKGELKEVRRTRGLQREARERAEHPTIALVGYTNAGKSSLFNRITGANSLAKNMLFATLDPTMRGVKLPSGRQAILADTVGFISELPTHLVEAFRATLEEVQMADVIVHVRDVADPDTRAQQDAVMTVLADLGIGADDPRFIEVLNKVDLLSVEAVDQLHEYARRATEEAHQAPIADDLRPMAKNGVVCVSALTGQGVDELLFLIDEAFSSTRTTYSITLPIDDGAALSWLYAHGHILERRDRKATMVLKVELDPANYGRFIRRFSPKGLLKNKDEASE